MPERTDPVPPDKALREVQDLTLHVLDEAAEELTNSFPASILSLAAWQDVMNDACDTVLAGLPMAVQEDVTARARDSMPARTAPITRGEYALQIRDVVRTERVRRLHQEAADDYAASSELRAALDKHAAKVFGAGTD